MISACANSGILVDALGVFCRSGVTEYSICSVKTMFDSEMTRTISVGLGGWYGGVTVIAVRSIEDTTGDVVGKADVTESSIWAVCGVASKPPDEISTPLSTCSVDVASSLVLVSLNGGAVWAYGNEVMILVVHVVAFMMGHLLLRD